MFHHRVLIVLLSLGLLLPIGACGGTTRAISAPPTAIAAPSAEVATLDSIARAAVKDGILPGLSVAVERNGRPVYTQGIGLARVESGVPVTPETVFRIGSVTKQFTAAAILRLAEQGQLSLDDEITKFIPDYPTRANRVTLRHLLNHTSGIRSYTSLGARWASRMAEDLSHEEMLALFQDEPFDFAPGERWLYNNSGYYLLGMVIERASGRSYSDYLQQEFLSPLGLENTSYCPNRPGARHAGGYKPSAGGAAVADPFSMTHPYAAGALCSTAQDLVKWNRALVEGRVVTPESYREMASAGTLASGAPLGYGYGLAIGALEGVRRVSHGGGINGFAASLSYYPEHDVTIAVLANSGAANLAQLEAHLARAALGLPPQTRSNLPLSAEERARYTGTYDLGRLQLRVFEQAGRLMGQATNQPAFPLLNQGEHTFLVDVPQQEIRLVFQLEGGRATGLVIYQGGAVIPAKRVS